MRMKDVFKTLIVQQQERDGDSPLMEWQFYQFPVALLLGEWYNTRCFDIKKTTGEVK